MTEPVCGADGPRALVCILSADHSGYHLAAVDGSPLKVIPFVGLDD